MSTLMERAAAMVPQMEWIRDAQAQEEQTKALQEVNNFLDRHREETRSIVQCTNALRECGLLPDRFLDVHLQSIREKLVPLRERLTTTPSDIKRNNFWANTQRALSGSVEALKQALLELWQGHLDDLSPSLDELQDLIRADTFGDDLKRIRALQTKIESTRLTLPISVTAIKEATTDGLEIRELVGRLDFDQIPPNVKKFLNAVFLRDVSLSELEPDVHTWLVEKNIAKGFRITSVRSR